MFTVQTASSSLGISNYNFQAIVERGLIWLGHLRACILLFHSFNENVDATLHKELLIFSRHRTPILPSFTNFD